MFLEVFGQVVTLSLFLRLYFPLFRSLYRRYLPPDLIWQPKADNWAVVTGGTDGIGLAYCKQLASMGYPLMVISRSVDKLNAVREELQSTVANCPEIRVLPFDFSRNEESEYEKIEAALAALARVHVLVNNVGVSFRAAEYFTSVSKTEPDLFEAMINVNVVAMIKMTRMVLGQMMDRDSGIIVNVGSISALSPTPLLSLYSATKAFVDNFTQTLSLECAHREGVMIQSVLPGFVSTKMSRLRQSLRVPDAQTYVESAIQEVGRTNRTYGYWVHTWIGRAYELIAYFFGQNLNSAIAFKELYKLRKRYYKIKDLHGN